MDTNLPVNQKPIEAQWRTQSSESQVDEELSLAEVRRVFVKRRFQILLVTAAIFAITCFYTFFVTPIYESAARLQIDPSRSANYGLEDLLNEKLSSDETSSQIATQVKILESDTIAAQVIKTLALSRNPEFAGKDSGANEPLSVSDMTPSKRQQILGQFRRALSVQVLPNTQIVEVRFQNSNPKLATEIVNAVIRAYIERNFQTRFEGTAQVANWLSTQMGDLKSQAVQAQQKLADFQRQNVSLHA